MFSYSFDMRKKIWNEMARQKFCDVNSALMFAVEVIMIDIYKVAIWKDGRWLVESSKLKNRLFITL
jgi:hypothetical protein